MKKKKNKTEMTVHEMAVRLCEGGSVWIEGHLLSAQLATVALNCCLECKLDSICSPALVELCSGCDAYDRKSHYLVLQTASGHDEET